MFSIFIAAWCGHTDASREMAEDIRLAILDLGMSMKEAAIVMGITPEQFSAQLAGREPLNCFRLGYLPPLFAVTWLKRRGARIGAAVITADELDLIRGAAALGRKRMLEILPLTQEERRRA